VNVADADFPQDDTADESAVLRRVEALLASFPSAALGLQLLSTRHSTHVC
jgi:hypothetical protein